MADKVKLDMSTSVALDQPVKLDLSTSVPLDQPASTRPKSAPEPSFAERIGLVPPRGSAPPIKPGEPGGPSLDVQNTGDLAAQIGQQAAQRIGSAYVRMGPKQALSGAAKLSQAMVHPGATDQAITGGHELISGTMNTLAPLAPESVVASPMAAARALVGGFALGKTGAAITQAAGGTPEQKQLVEDFGYLLGGAAGAKLSSKALIGAIANKGPTLTKIGAQLQGINNNLLTMLSPALGKLQRIGGSDPLSVLPERLQAGLRFAQDMSKPTEAAPQTPPAAPIAPQPAQPALPNATYLRPDIRSQVQQPPLTKSQTPLLDSLKEWDFINRTKNEMNAQTGSPQEEIVQKWIQDHNKKPGAPKILNKKQAAQAILAEAAKSAGVQVPAEIKVPKIGPFPAPTEVNNESDLTNLLQQSIARARAGK